MGYIVSVKKSPVGVELRNESMRFYVRDEPGKTVRRLSPTKVHASSNRDTTSVELSSEFLVAVLRLIASNPDVARAVAEFQEEYDEHDRSE